MFTYKFPFLKVPYKVELKTQLKIFVPLILGEICFAAMSTVDTVMASLAGTSDLSGVALGTALYWPVLMMLIGICTTVIPTVSMLKAQKNLHEIQKVLFNTKWTCTLLSVVGIVIVAITPFLFKLLAHDENMIYVATMYSYCMCVSLPFLTYFFVMRAYCEGLSFTKAAMYISIIMLVLDVPLNYIFIFGHFGAPRLGGVGCGVATMIINILSPFILYVIIKCTKEFKPYHEVKNAHHFDKSIVKQILKLGLPLGFSRTMEVSMFSMASLILSHFGAVVLAALSIAISVCTLFYIIPMCVSMAMTVRVSYAMGSNNFARAYLNLKTGLFLNFALFLVYGTMLLVFRDYITGLYTEDPKVLVMASILIIFNCLYLLPDSLQNFFLGVLLGFKDSKYILISMIVAYWLVGIPMCYLLSWGYLSSTPLEAYGIWAGFIIALVVAALMFSLRPRHLLIHKKMPKLLAKSFQA